jgi:hypothetical protein
MNQAIGGAVVRFHHRRGTAEQWIKEGKQTAHWTRLSCHQFRANEVRLQLSVLAYNLGNQWRQLVLPRRIDHWSLTNVQQRPVKRGGLGQTCPVPLAAAGRESSDTTLVRGDVAADLGSAGPDRLIGRSLSLTVWAKTGRNTGEVSEKMSEGSCLWPHFWCPCACHDARPRRQ